METAIAAITTMVWETNLEIVQKTEAVWIHGLPRTRWTPLTRPSVQGNPLLLHSASRPPSHPLVLPLVLPLSRPPSISLLPTHSPSLHQRVYVWLIVPLPFQFFNKFMNLLLPRISLCFNSSQRYVKGVNDLHTKITGKMFSTHSLYLNI